VLSLELGHEVVDHSVVKVLASQMGISSSRLHLEDAVLNGQDGHIEGTTSQVEDQHIALALALLVQPVGDCSSRRLVDDTKNIETLTFNRYKLQIC
jgi:hypothetical protein